MKVTLILAEYASAMPNGLFTLVNGGIESVATNEQAAIVQGSLLARIHQEAAEAGPHTLRITLMDQDGRQMAPPMVMSFESAPRTGAVALVFGVSLQLPIGSYGFHAVMDNQIAGSTELRIVRPAPAGGSGGAPPTQPPVGQ